MKYEKAFAELIVIEKGDIITTSSSCEEPDLPDDDDRHSGGRIHRPDDRPHRP